MKRENLNEARKIVDRLKDMEIAVKMFETSNISMMKKLCIRAVRFITGQGKKGFELEVGHSYNEAIDLSQKQQEELAQLLKKWIEEDKKTLETL